MNTIGYAYCGFDVFQQKLHKPTIFENENQLPIWNVSDLG